MTIRAKGIQKQINKAAVSILLAALQVLTSAHANMSESAHSRDKSTSISEGYTISDNGALEQSRSAQAKNLGDFHHQTHDRPTIWISDIGTLLFDDWDSDGYHSGFSITIDVNSEFGDTEVYAKIYLEPSYSASVLLHTTERFSVYGTTASDEYRVDTELRNNFEADYYNLSIDIHDAWSDELLTSANARGFNNLNQLPLESGEMTGFAGGTNQHLAENSFEHDNHYHANNNGAADVVVTEYAGLFHPAILLILFGSLLIRHRIRVKTRNTTAS